MPGQLLDFDGAFAALLGVWGRDYPTGQAVGACGFAREQGLGCLERQGSRRSLEFLDRPAMLLLQDESGSRGYAVVRHLQGDRAELVLPGGLATVSFASLEPFWFGEYRVLWRLPEYQTGDEFYGAGNGEQLWIGARMMELANKYAADGPENARVKRLPAEQQIRWYQQRKGLTVDGIAGAMTIIQINNDLNATVPRLVPVPATGKG